jgi:hypothetical protein
LVFLLTGQKRKHAISPTVTDTKIDIAIYQNIGAINFDWSTCGINKGCFRSPTGCQPDNCDVLVSWEEREDTVHFELSRALGSTPSNSHWIGLGFSPTANMVIENSNIA